MRTCVSLLWFCLVLGPGCGCSDRSGSQGVDASRSPDASLPDAHLPVPDAAVDGGGGRPDGTHYDFCNQPFFKLPIDGQTEDTWAIDIFGDGIAYSKNPVDNYETYDVYFLDIADCTGYRVTDQATATGVTIWEDLIVWSDSRVSSPEPDYHCKDLYTFDLAAWREVRLSQDPKCEWTPKTNGRYVLYRKNTQNGNPSPKLLLLWDLDTGIQQTLAPTEAQASYYGISPQYAVWSGRPEDLQSVGRDIYYHDLETSVTARVEFSIQHFTYGVATSGDHLVYMASDLWAMPPYHLVLYRISTQQVVMLAENDYGMPHGYIHENLVAWATTKYNGGTEIRPADIEMYDIRTGVFRRVTTRESNLRPRGIYFPYLVVMDVLVTSPIAMEDYYVANLVDLGITDDFGNLIPGDGVLEPPR